MGRLYLNAQLATYITTQPVSLFLSLDKVSVGASKVMKFTKNQSLKVLGYTIQLASYCSCLKNIFLHAYFFQHKQQVPKHNSQSCEVGNKILWQMTSCMIASYILSSNYQKLIFCIRMFQYSVGHIQLIELPACIQGYTQLIAQQDSMLSCKRVK